MAQPPADGQAPTGTPDRPPVATSTDEWLSRISDQLDVLLEQRKPPAKKTVGKRTEVRGT